MSKNKLLHEQFTNEQRATMYSMITFAGNVLFGIIAIGLASFVDRLGVRWTLLILQIAFVPIILLYIQVFRANNRSESTGG